MIGDLNGKHILLIIIGIIVLLWLIYWFMNRTKPTVTPLQPSHPLAPINNNSTGPATISTDHNNGQDAPFKLYYFYNPNCGACKRFEPTWRQIASKFNAIPGISAKSIDITNPDNESLSFYYNITRTPTIILVTPTKNAEFSGDRTIDNISNFVVSHVSEFAHPQ